MENWLKNLPPSGVRAICSWERFCTFAREPERRRVGGDARVSVDGVNYEVDPHLAGETVILWWGIFDNELYIEYGDKRFGPYAPVGGPIPLYRYRAFKIPNSGQTESRRSPNTWRCLEPLWRTILKRHCSLATRKYLWLTLWTQIPSRNSPILMHYGQTCDSRLPGHCARQASTRTT
jgi:hypothetical protein